jgi:2-succinyl-6-hydroxy-2,4-cyclohexadiene-1-carboxylate synthase
VAESLVLLHGFSGTRHAWGEVAALLSPERYRPLALDLPGHGDSVTRAHVTFSSCVDAVLADAPTDFVLCGYSLGGRVALHVALSAPDRVSRLVLVASTAGLDDETERVQRRAADRKLAEELEQVPFEEFIERWRTQPLFADDPAEVDARAREDQRRNDPLALADALRGLGTGEMAPLWDRLGELPMPVTVVVGERDAKFRALGERMTLLLPAGELVVIPGGHVLPLESPFELAAVLNRV